MPNGQDRLPHERYPDLQWALNNNNILSDLCSNGTVHPELLQIVNGKIGSLRQLGCSGIQERFRGFTIGKLYAILSELEVAELFLRRGYPVTLLPDNYFPGPSPDLLVTMPSTPLFVEVTHISSSDPGAILIDRLREIIARYPYIINFTFHLDVSSPHLTHMERNNQEAALSASLATFSEDLQQLQTASLPVTRNIGAFSYEIIGIHPSGRGYPAVLTSSSMIPLDHSFSYLTLRIQKKAEKRTTFPSSEQNIPYLIAIVCDEHGIDPYEVKELLYGSTIEYGLNQDNSIYRAIREKNWARILRELEQQNIWPEIQRARESGWESLLNETYLIPHDYCYVKETGLYLNAIYMKSVSGVLFCNASRRVALFPNPFSSDQVIGSSFWTDLRSSISNHTHTTE